jgi:hypothetical protein
MDTQHVGVLRLHEIASENLQLTPSELNHLDACEACMKVFSVISRAFTPEDKPLIGIGSAQAEFPTQPRSSILKCSEDIAWPPTE